MYSCVQLCTASVLDVFGPLCTLVLRVHTMESTVTSDGVVELDATGVRSFQDCLKHALLLTGDVVARISTNRRELVLKKNKPPNGVVSSRRVL